MYEPYKTSKSFLAVQVGMAATLASVCSVPLTSVLLLFELTKDYRILLPLMVKIMLITILSWLRFLPLQRLLLSYIIFIGVLHIHFDWAV